MRWHRVQYVSQKAQASVVTPRFTTCFGGDDFRFMEGGSAAVNPNGYEIPPRELPEALRPLTQLMNRVCGTRFNFVLMNYYKDGGDSVSYHSDDEPWLGKNPVIASVSLGIPRTFTLKHKTDKSVDVLKYTLLPGSLLIMQGGTQHNWLHSIPKSNDSGGRINLTFRVMSSVTGTNNYYHYNVGTGPSYVWDNASKCMVLEQP